MTVELLSITHNVEETPPLTVRFAWHGSEYVMGVPCRDLQTFSRFQAAVADKCGLFIRHDDAEGRRRDAALLWADDVERAFEVGRSELG